MDRYRLYSHEGPGQGLGNNPQAHSRAAGHLGFQLPRASRDHPVHLQRASPLVDRFIVRDP
jgi:hypothetical protein